MPTVAILGTRKLHYESKQEIDVVSKKLFGISRDGHIQSRCSQLVECRNRTNVLGVLAVGIGPCPLVRLCLT